MRVEFDIGDGGISKETKSVQEKKTDSFLPKHPKSSIRRPTSNLAGHVARGPVIVLVEVLDTDADRVRHLEGRIAKAAVAPGQQAGMHRPANGRYSALSVEDCGELLPALLELAWHSIGGWAIHRDVPGGGSSATPWWRWSKQVGQPRV